MKKIITILTLLNPFYTPAISLEVEDTNFEYEEYHNPFLGINKNK